MAGVVGELSASDLRLTWKVPGFLDRPEKNKYELIKCPEFRFADASWYLKMRPSRWFPSEPFFISLIRSSSSVRKHGVSFTLGLMTSRGGKHRLLDIEDSLDDSFPYIAVGSFKRSLLEERRDLFVPEGNLTLYWDMRLTASDSLDVQRTEAAGAPSVAPALSHEEELRKRLQSLEKLQSDYKELLKSGAGSDVCLVVSGKEFRAHQLILKARSPVFRAMFDHETEEKVGGKVVIDDLDPDSFPDFLGYVYAGRVEAFSDDNVFGLYVAADKYDLQTLKSECLVYMRHCLSVHCFCDVMMLSLRYKEQDLMDLAIEFFKKNMARIIVTVKWQVFLNENGTAANELLIKALVPEQDKP